MGSRADAKRGVRSTSRRRNSSETPALSPTVIIDAALRCIDRDGLESFSLRNLAAELGVYPTAIYWYVPNRNELMARVVARMLQDIQPKQGRKSWQDYLRDLFKNFRATIGAHPNLAPLVGTQIVSNTSVELDFVEGILSALSQAGLTGPALVAAYNTVIAAVVGFTAQEFAPMPTEDTATWQKQVQERLLSINRNAYPLLSANLPLLSNHAFILRWENGVDAPLDESFGIFVEVVIAGIESLLPGKAQGRRASASRRSRAVRAAQ